VASDVWSLGLSLLEMGLGRFPYPSDHMYGQIIAIVNDPPPDLPETYSDEARDFIKAW
jgi:mitogen-activated protein kinase kinase